MQECRFSKCTYVNDLCFLCTSERQGLLLLTISHYRSKCPAPLRTEINVTASGFCIQLHVLSAHQWLINITGSPVIPLCSSVYTQLLLHFMACTAGHFQQVAVVSINPKSKLGGVWESVVPLLFLHISHIKNMLLLRLSSKTTPWINIKNANKILDRHALVFKM